MNPKKSFAHFLPGGNSFACQAAHDVAEERRVINPLLLFGPAGTGKTHLLTAIGLRFLERRPMADVLWMTGANVCEEVVRGYRRGDPSPLLERFERADLILVDDWHLVFDSARTPAAFAEALRSAKAKGVPMALASKIYFNHYGSEMPGNLRDVFAAGLAVNLDALDVPTRAKILCHMCREQEVTIPENTAVLVVRRLGANLHKLEGAATEIVSLTQFHGRPVTVEDLRVAQDNQGLVSCDQIVSAVADAYLVRPVDIKGSQRLKRMVAPRHLAMYLVRRGSQLSLPEIGRRFGGRDHTTVMHAIHRIEEKLLADAHFRLRALDIARRLGIDLEIGPLSS